jgi:hypothetical protein
LGVIQIENIEIQIIRIFNIFANSVKNCFQVCFGSAAGNSLLPKNHGLIDSTNELSFRHIPRNIMLKLIISIEIPNEKLIKLYGMKKKLMNHFD